MRTPGVGRAVSTYANRLFVIESAPVVGDCPVLGFVSLRRGGASVGDDPCLRPRYEIGDAVKGTGLATATG